MSKEEMEIEIEALRRIVNLQLLMISDLIEQNVELTEEIVKGKDSN